MDEKTFDEKLKYLGELGDKLAATIKMAQDGHSKPKIYEELIKENKYLKRLMILILLVDIVKLGLLIYK